MFLMAQANTGDWTVDSDSIEVGGLNYKVNVGCPPWSFQSRLTHLDFKVRWRAETKMD